MDPKMLLRTRKAQRQRLNPMFRENRYRGFS